jgi:hypothetical protein
MIDPERFDLSHYHKSPFCSFVIKFPDATSMAEFRTELDKDFFATLQRYCSMYHLEMLNLYTDQKYDEIVTKFDKSCLFHSVILYIDTTDTPQEETEMPEPQLLIGALPFNGIVSPITKSAFYTLYNGKFIPCKKFCLESHPKKWYNSIVYVLVDIHSDFTIHEFHSPKENSKYGVGIQYIWALKKMPENGKLNLAHMQIENPVLYAGNEQLFTKPNRNLFHLSDIPSDVINRGSSITKKLS